MRFVPKQTDPVWCVCQPGDSVPSCLHASRMGHRRINLTWGKPGHAAGKCHAFHARQAAFSLFCLAEGTTLPAQAGRCLFISVLEPPFSAFSFFSSRRLRTSLHGGLSKSPGLQPGSISRSGRRGGVWHAKWRSWEGLLPVCPPVPALPGAEPEPPRRFVRPR